MNSVLKKRKALKIKLEKTLKKMGEGWHPMFYRVFPKYLKRKHILHNVIAGRSLDEEVINDLIYFERKLRVFKPRKKYVLHPKK